MYSLSGFCGSKLDYRQPPQTACDFAIALASNKLRLDSIKARMAATKHECHLFNTVEFTRDLERMYQ